MSNKKQTALQKLILEIEEQAKTCPMKDRKFYIYCKMLATQKLPIEKEQIIDAVDGFPIENRNMLGQEYYQETYGDI